MKSKLTLLLGFAAIIFVWQACEFVKVNTPELDLTKHYQAEYVINGVVLSDDATPVAGAAVKIGDTQVITDNNGAYQYRSSTCPLSGTLIQVVSDGFVRSTNTLAYSDNPPLVASYDFTLTRRNGSQTVSAQNGGTFNFNGITVEIPAGNNFTVNGQEQSSINLEVTSLNSLSMLGNSIVGNHTLKTFSFEPDHTVFSKPIKVSFTAPDGYEFTNELQYRILNETTGNWELNENQVKYDFVSEIISVEVDHFSNGKVVDPETIEYSLPLTIQSEFLQRITASSCDCEGPFVFENEYIYTRQIVNVYTGPAAATWEELLYFNILSDNYIPYSTAYVAGIPTIGTINPVGLGTCDLLTWDLSYVLKRVTGTFMYNGELKHFDLKYYFAISSVFGDTEECPVTSGCHQGCP